jgi:hypothetical protein
VDRVRARPLLCCSRRSSVCGPALCVGHPPEARARARAPRLSSRGARLPRDSAGLGLRATREGQPRLRARPRRDLRLGSAQPRRHLGPPSGTPRGRDSDAGGRACGRAAPSGSSHARERHQQERTLVKKADVGAAALAAWRASERAQLTWSPCPDRVWR